MGHERDTGPTPQRAARERAELARLADEVLPVLVARLVTSDLGELEVHSSAWRVRLRRADAAASGGGAHADPASGSRSPSSGETLPGHVPAPGRSSTGVARAPAVGYFSPRPDLAVGLPVRAGDGLGHVEVLGLRQPVHAPVDGIVGRLLAEDGQAVEYGQELVRVDELGSGSPPEAAADAAPAGPPDVPGAAEPA